MQFEVGSGIDEGDIKADTTDENEAHIGNDRTPPTAHGFFQCQKLRFARLSELRAFLNAASEQEPDHSKDVSGTSNPRSAFGSDLRFFGGDFTVEDFDNGRPG